MNETVPTPCVVIGVDTHKLTHAAVAIDTLGARVGIMTVPANGKGYQALETWARSLGLVRAFGVEGTGVYQAVGRHDKLDGGDGENWTPVR
jgi:transposase